MPFVLLRDKLQGVYLAIRPGELDRDQTQRKPLYLVDGRKVLWQGAGSWRIEGKDAVELFEERADSV